MKITDRTKIKNLLDKLNIEYKEVDLSFILEVGNEKVSGYIGFAAEFAFNEDESFKEIALGEY